MLEELDLSNHKLDNLPAEIGQLTSLRWLYLRDNRLTSLPAEIGQLTSLSNLDLKGNQLTSLPADIRQLTVLKVLSLTRNQLTRLPAEIGQLTSLIQLEIDHIQQDTTGTTDTAIDALKQNNCTVERSSGEGVAADADMEDVPEESDVDMNAAPDDDDDDDDDGSGADDDDIDHAPGGYRRWKKFSNLEHNVYYKSGPAKTKKTKGWI